MRRKHRDLREKRVPIDVWCTVSFKKRVQAAAAVEGKSAAEFVREAVKLCVELVEERKGKWVAVAEGAPSSEGGDRAG